MGTLTHEEITAAVLVRHVNLIIDANTKQGVAAVMDERYMNVLRSASSLYVACHSAKCVFESLLEVADDTGNNEVATHLQTVIAALDLTLRAAREGAMEIFVHNKTGQGQ